MEIVNDYYNASFNGILVNRYNTGKETIGAHSDGEDGLDPSGGVVAISVGTSRKFRIRSIKKDLLYSTDMKTPVYSIKPKQIIKDVYTLPYHTIHMGGNFQKSLLMKYLKKRPYQVFIYIQNA